MAIMFGWKKGIGGKHELVAVDHGRLVPQRVRCLEKIEDATASKICQPASSRRFLRPLADVDT